MKNLESNDPVMWRKKEYRFVRYPVGSPAKAVILTTEQTNRQWLTVPLNELDLILEFDLGEEK